MRVPKIWLNLTEMRTHRLIMAIWAIFALSLLGFMTAAQFTGKQMDKISVVREKELIDNAISLRLTQSLSELRSVAWWDDMVLKSRKAGFDSNWLDIEVGVFVTTSYHHDRILILDEADQPVYGFGSDTRLKSNIAQKYAASLAPLIAQVRGGKNASPRILDSNLTEEMRESSTITNRSYGRGAAALIEVDGKPVLASIMAITPSINMKLNSAHPRLLASFIDVTPAVLTELGKSILIPDLTKRRGVSNATATIALNTDDGKQLGDLIWSPKRPGTELLSALTPYGIAAISMLAAVLALLGFSLLRSTKKLAQREVDAQHLANHDALTNLPNRRHLEQELFQRADNSIQDSTRLTCAVIDLDRFKDINDTLGHAAGDQLIKVVANRLSTALRPDDFVARLGGDEFAILRNCRGLSDAEDLTTRITSVFARPFPVMGHDIETAASVGISMSAMNRAVDDLMREADIALYEAKAKQKGTTVQFAPAMASKIEQRRALEVDLKMAIANRALTMAYQPIVEATTGAVTSVEALVRWNSPKHGVVPPDVFVAIAEETGMMAELGRFVIDQSIEDSKRWPKVKTSINVSPAQLRSASIVQDLLRPARAQGVSPMQIILEITETVLMSNDKRTLHTLNILKEQGFGLALDDFGTGYSSLAYVRDFPFDKLKIDRSFVHGQKDKGRSLDIVKAVVNFGRVLGREVIAEGIETEEEMQAMQAAGVTHLQGYLFSKPISATHLEALIATSGRLTAARAVRDVPEVTTIDRSLATKLRHVA